MKRINYRGECNFLETGQIYVLGVEPKPMPLAVLHCVDQ